MTCKKGRVKDVQGSLFGFCERPEPPSASEIDTTNEHAELVLTQDLAEVPINHGGEIKKITRLNLGAPVVLYGDEKKIKDADLYRGCSCKKNSQGGCIKAQNEPHILRKTYSPLISLAADAKMVDYDPVLHRDHFKYIVVNDNDLDSYLKVYKDEFGPAETCGFFSRSDFFLSLCQAKAEEYLRSNGRPIRMLETGALLHVADYALNAKDELYDAAVEIGLTPLYDLPGYEHAFKYIICKKDSLGSFSSHNAETMQAVEFDAIVTYTKWMRAHPQC